MLMVGASGDVPMFVLKVSVGEWVNLLTMAQMRLAVPAGATLVVGQLMASGHAFPARRVAHSG
jgi:hypothetical protein